MFKLSLGLNEVLEAVKATVPALGMPVEGKQIVARLVVAKGVVTGAEVGIANEGEDVSSFYPAPSTRAGVKRGPRKAAADKA